MRLHGIWYNTSMRGYVGNIEEESLINEYFRKVVYTAKHSQLVLMSLKPGEDIGEETHPLDQFFRCEAGTGKAVVSGVEYPVRDGTAIVVPAGTKHNIINTSPDIPMKLYTIYSPPNHRNGTLHRTKAEAEADDEHFDGRLTE